MKKIPIILLSLSFIFLSLSEVYKKPSDNRAFLTGYIPPNGFIPNAMTAIKIAEAIWYPIYGNKIYTKKPFKASLKKNIWIVEGSLPANSEGGIPYIEIQKKDGKVLKVLFDK